MGRRSSERPTVPPGFDVAKYAKDSDAHLRKVKTKTRKDLPAATTPQSETRIATRPRIGFSLTDETWARSMTGAPAIAIADERYRRLPLDHRAGFLVSRMDGTIDLETLIAVSCMPREEALRIVRDLYESGVITFK
jgi:hypothetical protein